MRIPYILLRHARPRARPVRPGPMRSGAARAAREELLEDMLLVDGGARIEEKDHLYRRQSQTSAHIVLDGLSSSCRGQRKEERTCPKDRLAHAPPPPAALSSHVLDRHGEEACALAGATSTVPHVASWASTQTCLRDRRAAAPARSTRCAKAQLAAESRGSSTGRMRSSSARGARDISRYGKALQSAHQTTLYRHQPLSPAADS